MDVRRLGRALRFGAVLATAAAVGCATPSPTAQRRKRPRPAAVEAKDDDDKGAATLQAGKFPTPPGAAVGAAAGAVAVASVPGTTATTPVTPLLGGAKTAMVVVLGATPVASTPPKPASPSTPTLPTIAIKPAPVASLAAATLAAKNNVAGPATGASTGAGTTTGATASSASLSPGAIALANAAATSISAAPSSAAPAVVGPSGVGASTAVTTGGSSSGGPRSTVIGTFRTIRRIAMFYRLDLRESGPRSRAIADALRPFDDRVRACYVARLADRPEMGGALVLAFELTPSAPTMQRIARIGGTLDDETLVKCVTARLSTIPLTPAAATRGTLSYRFSAQERVVAGHSRGDTASAASGAKPIRRTLADEEHEAVTVRLPDPNARP